MTRHLIAGLLAILLLAGCGPARGAEPTPAPTPIPAATATPPPTATPAPTAAPEAATEPAPTGAAAPVVVEFWTTEVQPARLDVYEAVAERFMSLRPEVQVQIVPVEEAQVSRKLAEAAAQGRLPDIARLGVERIAALGASGLLDEAAAAAVVRAVGVDDFRDGPLRMVTNPVTDRPRAVPYDGWLQAIWYRKDIFDTLGLAAPVTWDQVDAACDALTQAAEPAYGLALPTDPTANYVHQVFEQVAMANNAWPFDANGRPAFTAPAMVEALRFYTDLQRCSSPAPQAVAQAAERYLRGDAGMLFYSTYIMDDLVQGNERADGSRIEPSLPDLAQRSGFSSSLVGPGGTASYGQLVTLALLRGADPVAQEVVRFFLTEGYLDILALAPLGKVPVLTSVVGPWTELSPIFDNYSPATLGHIANGYETMMRWVLRPEYNDAQRAAIGALEGNLLIPQAIDRIVRGEMTPEAAAGWLQGQMESLLAAQ
jgi:multiple sugar transport system substrate-binding protein